MSTIKELIRQLADSGQENYCVVGIVKSVEGLSCTVEPVNGDADILDVRLTAGENDDQFFYLIPKLDSVVVVSFLNKHAGYVSMFSEVSEIRAKIGESLYEMDEAGFKIAKGNDTMLEVISLIIESVNQILVLQGNNPNYQKLNQALQKAKNILK